MMVEFTDRDGMTLDEAIEALGSLVSSAGGEGDEALDVVKDAAAILARIEYAGARAAGPLPERMGYMARRALAGEGWPER